MCVGLTSKVLLGVAVCAAATCGGIGCQSNAASRPVAEAVVPSASPVSVALADGPPLDVPAAPASPTEPAVSQSDLIAWMARGTTDDVILDRIQHAPNPIRLTAGEEMRLRDAGATDEVIHAIKATAWN